MTEKTIEIFSPFLQDRKTTACFSGHRPEKIPFDIFDTLSENSYYSFIYLHIHEAYMAGYRTFLTGMARGFDILAATAVINYRYRFNVTEKINLIGVSPFSDEIERLNGQDLFNYNFVKSNCDEMIYLNKSYTQWCYHQRNRFMVDHSSLLISSCLDENSGTGSTIRYAHKKGVRVDNISLNDLKEPVKAGNASFPKEGYWIIDSGKKGTVRHIRAPHPFLPVNDTSDEQKKQ